MEPIQIIITRVLKEIQDGQTIALGSGIPQLIKPHLTDAVQLKDPAAEQQRVDLAVVEAAEISQQGDLALISGEELHDLKADHWIVATPHTRETGEAKIVQTCQLSVSHHQCAATIITELGVLQISEVGLVLTEVAPGISTDDIKNHTAASIHVADDIKVMEL